MAKGSKKMKKGGRKSSLLISRKKDKNGNTYHVNNKTGKKVSGDIYRMQWHNGKRVSNKSITETVDYVKKYADEDSQTWRELQATHDRFIQIEKLDKKRKSEIKVKELDMLIAYVNLRDQSNAWTKAGIDYSYKILLPNGEDYENFTSEEGAEIISNFIFTINSQIKEAKEDNINLSGEMKKRKIAVSSYLPHVEQTVTPPNKKGKGGVLKINLRDLVGMDEEGVQHRTDALDMLEAELKKDKG